MTDIKQYRKKPVVIEAWQVNSKNYYEVAKWCGGETQDISPSGTIYAPGVLLIHTLEGDHWASDGDYIMKGVKGEFYPCKPDIFEMTYEEVSND